MPRNEIFIMFANTALVHGATGLCWFSFDVDSLRRHAGGWGIGPAPLASYNDAGEGYVADEAKLKTIRELWQTVADVNREIAELTPFLYAPTAAEAYRVMVRGAAVSETPVRTLLKRAGERWLLIVVNIDNAALDVRIEPPEAMQGMTVRRRFGADVVRRSAAGVLETHLAPFAMGVVELLR